MTIEHRWSERKPIQIDVALYYGPLGTVPGKTRDISLEGMYVMTRGIDLPLHAELEVSFITPSGGGSGQEHHMPAYVVHQSDEGVGLMLRHVDYSDFYALRYMLNAA